jgi:hypothetical protein
MPTISDVFNSDAFGVISMTENINNIPYTPSRIEAMGLYNGDGAGAGAGITTQQLAVVNTDGLLQLIPAAALSTMPNFQKVDQSDIRYITVPHLPLNYDVLAHELPGKSAFGMPDATMNDSQRQINVQEAISNKQALMVRNHHLTWEYMRLASLKGILLDADGSTVLYNWFTEFDITQKTITWTVATLDDINGVCDEINKHIADVLGADSYTGITCFVGNDFMTSLTNDPSLENGFIRLNEGSFYRENFVYGSFTYKGISFENYRGMVGGDDLVETNKGYAFPTGTNAFVRRNAPGDLDEAVGRPGLPMYSARERKKFGIGWDLHSQSNPIFMCQRPGVLVEVTTA